MGMCILLLFRKATGFSELISYLAFSVKLLIISTSFLVEALVFLMYYIICRKG